MLAHLERNHRFRLRQKFLPIVEGHLFEALALMAYFRGFAGVADLEVLCVHGQNLPHGRRGVSEILDRCAVGKSGLIFHVWSS